MIRDRLALVALDVDGTSVLATRLDRGDVRVDEHDLDALLEQGVGSLLAAATTRVARVFVEHVQLEGDDGTRVSPSVALNLIRLLLEERSGQRWAPPGQTADEVLQDLEAQRVRLLRAGVQPEDEAPPSSAAGGRLPAVGDVDSDEEPRYPNKRTPGAEPSSEGQLGTDEAEAREGDQGKPIDLESEGEEGEEDNPIVLD